MLTEPAAPTRCLHRVISAAPEDPIGTCLECGEEVDVRAVERLWQQLDEPDPTGHRTDI